MRANDARKVGFIVFQRKSMKKNYEKSWISIISQGEAEAEEESQHDILANLLADVAEEPGAQRKCALTTRETFVSPLFSGSL